MGGDYDNLLKISLIIPELNALWLPSVKENGILSTHPLFLVPASCYHSTFVHLTHIPLAEEEINYILASNLKKTNS